MHDSLRISRGFADYIQLLRVIARTVWAIQNRTEDVENILQHAWKGTSRSVLAVCTASKFSGLRLQRGLSGLWNLHVWIQPCSWRTWIHFHSFGDFKWGLITNNNEEILSTKNLKKETSFHLSEIGNVSTWAAWLKILSVWGWSVTVSTYQRALNGNMQLIWEAVTKILSEGNCWENSEDWTDGNTMSLFRYIPTMLSPEGSHNQPSELVFRIFLGGNHLPSAPWEPDRVPRAEARSLGLISDRIQMLLECGRGQHRSVEASRQHWLIGVRIKLGVTFPDCDPSFCLIFFPPNALTIPSHRVCCHGVSRRLCFMLSAETAQSSAGSVTLKSGTLPHLCWALMKSFTFI